MDATRNRLIREEQHATRLARQAVDGSGTRRAVARRWGRMESTVSHYAGGKTCPEFRDALRLAMRLAGGSAKDQTTARGFRDAVDEALQIGELEQAESAVLRDRVVYLIGKEPELEAAQKRALLLSRPAWRQAMLAEAYAQIEAVDADLVLEARGEPDPRAEFRRRECGR